jgi:hypothetical protein
VVGFGVEFVIALAQYASPSIDTTVITPQVGLAEQSPHLPLKVLHKVLDEAQPGEAVVGIRYALAGQCTAGSRGLLIHDKTPNVITSPLPISNWALDPAKMNRAVHLYRPAPTVEDLSLTAQVRTPPSDCIHSSDALSNEKHVDEMFTRGCGHCWQGMVKSANLKGYLHALARSYNQVGTHTMSRFPSSKVK